MKYQVAKTIGLNTDQQAAQTASSKIDEENGFFAVIDLTCDDAFTRERALLTDLQDFYLEEDGTPAEKLTNIFQKANEALQDIEKKSILLAAISGKVLYLIGSGEIEAFLKRGNTFSPLLNGGSEQIISGFLEANDRILFTSKGLLDLLGDDLKKSLNLALPDWEEEITSRIATPIVEETKVPLPGSAGLLLEVLESNQDEESKKPTENQVPNLSETQENVPVDIPISVTQEQSSLAFPTVGNRFKDLAMFLPTIKKTGHFFINNKKGRLVLAAILIVILIIGLGLKFKSSKDHQKQVQIEALLIEAKNDFNSATNLATLNPTEANNKLNLAKDKVSQALALDSKNAAAVDLKKQIDTQGVDISGKFAASDFSVFLDLELVKTGFKASNLSLFQNNIALIDSVNKTLAEITISKTSNQILAGKDQLGDGQKVSAYEGAVFVYSKDKGILRVDTSNKKITQVAKSDKNWGNIVDLYAFGGNVYALDSGKNQIWKYLPTTDGYSDSREYLDSSTKADFGNAIKMQIDSSVYVLKQNGEMIRFTKGVVDNFSYGGLDKGVKDPKSFFVSSDTDNLYLLDSGNSRLLVLNKTGQFIKEYQGDEFAKATDLVVDETGKKAYLLDGSKIYQVELK